MNNKAFEAIKKHSLIDNDDNICIALSGGADSVALLHFIYANRYTLDINNIYACHLNHCLRGEESQRDYNYVKNLCEYYNIELISKTVDINKLVKEQSLSIELCAREQRYSFFKDISKEKNCKIATAHTHSDSMETTIFNLARGSGVKGLVGIPPKREYIIRPLITSTREDIEQYIKENNLQYVTDSTNLTDIYTRNRIRHNIIPQLYNINLNANTAFLRLYEQLNDIMNYIDTEAVTAAQTISTVDGYKKESFLALNNCLKTEIIANILREKNISPSREKIDNIMSIIEKEGTLQLCKDTFFICKDNLFKIVIKNNSNRQEYITLEHILEGNCGTYLSLNGNKYNFVILSYEQIENFKENYNLDLKYLIDYDKIDRSAIIRQKLDGDRIKLKKSNTPIKLKKLYNDNKIPLQMLSQLLVIAYEDKVLWAEQIGSCDDLLITKDTKQILAVFAEDKI